MLIEYIALALQKHEKRAEGDIHHLNKRIQDAKEQQLFKRLAEGIQIIPYFEQAKKAEMLQQLKQFQTLIDSLAMKQKKIRVLLNKYTEKECKKIFTFVLEMQQQGQVLLQASYCNRKQQVERYLQKYQQMYMSMQFWTHLSELESRYDKVTIDLECLKQFQEPQQHFNQGPIVKTVAIQTVPLKQEIVYIEKEIVKDDKKTQELLDDLKNQIKELKNRELVHQQKLKLLKAHEIVYGINTLQLENGFEIYDELNTEESLNALAFAFQLGKVVVQNVDQAKKIYQLSIQQFNSLQAMFQLGKILMLNESNLQQGIQYLKKAADQGHIEASLDLGILYYNGVMQGNLKILDKSEKLAIHYISKGKHTSRGLCDMGIIEKDPKKKVEYFNQSINNKYWQAYYYLGQYYEETQQQELAKEQYILGIKHQNIDCNEALLKYLYEEAIERNLQPRFIDYLQKLCVTKQSGEAFYYLGLCNPNNLFIQQVYYQLGAKLQNQKCMLKLDELMQEIPIYEHYQKEKQDEILFKMGEYHTKQGHFENAAQYYKQAQTQESYRRLSEIYKSQNEALSQIYENMANINSDTEMVESLIYK